MLGRRGIAPVCPGFWTGTPEAGSGRLSTLRYNIYKEGLAAWKSS
jgi:hypothetical protein